MQMADFMPIAAPAWRHLRDLTLAGMGFSDFPEGLASVLKRLTRLDLAHNKFARLPAAVKLLSNLQHFELPKTGLCSWRKRMLPPYRRFRTCKS